jgi:hypothetical protein
MHPKGAHSLPLLPNFFFSSTESFTLSLAIFISLSPFYRISLSLPFVEALTFSLAIFLSF